MRKILLLIFATAAFSIFALDQPKLAVYGFKSQTFSKRDIASLNSVLESALIDLGYFKVLTRDDIKLILKERKLSDMGLVQPEDFGRMIGSKYVVFGSVEKSFGKYGYVTVSVKIIDVDSGEIVFADASNVPAPEVDKAIKRIVSEIRYGKNGIYKIKREKLAVKPVKNREKESFLSFGVYYVYTYDEYYDYLQEWYIPMLRYGVFKGDSAYGVNLLLGGFYRKYFGVLYGEIGTVMLFIPYIEGGLKLGPIELSVFDFMFPGISLSFTF